MATSQMQTTLNRPSYVIHRADKRGAMATRAHSDLVK
jgi:hypothetical protein